MNIKEFATKNKKTIIIVGAVVGIATVGIVGYKLLGRPAIETIVEASEPVLEAVQDGLTVTSF